MHYRHNTTTRENGRPRCTKFETSQKNQPPHRMRQPANSTNQKTIGINKLGTLLSSQTTGATGTKHNQTAVSSLRSNFTSLPAPTRPCKSAPSRITSPKTSTTTNQQTHTTDNKPEANPSTVHSTRQNNFNFIKGGSSPSPGQLHNYTTTPPPPPNPPPPTTTNRENRHPHTGSAGFRGGSGMQDDQVTSTIARLRLPRRISR